MNIATQILTAVFVLCFLCIILLPPTSQKKATTTTLPSTLSESSQSSSPSSSLGTLAKSSSKQSHEAENDDDDDNDSDSPLVNSSSFIRQYVEHSFFHQLGKKRKSTAPLGNDKNNKIDLDDFELVHPFRRADGKKNSRHEARKRRLHLVEDEKIHYPISNSIHPFISSQKDSSSSSSASSARKNSAVIVIGTGEMRSYDRCGPRLKKTILEPNNAFMTMFTFTNFLKTDDLNRRIVQANPGPTSGRGKKKFVMPPPSAGGRRNRRRFTHAAHHSRLKQVYGDHLALSVLMNSDHALNISRRETEAHVTFPHFFTVLAQWLVIEHAASRTLSFLRDEEVRIRNTSSTSDQKLFQFPSNFIFIRVRPDVFIVGTQVLFDVVMKKQVAGAEHNNNKRFEARMKCGEENETWREHEAHDFTDDSLGGQDFKKTFIRTTSFPETEWPLDPLSDYSSIFVVSSSAASSTSSSSSSSLVEDLVADSPILRKGFRLFSWSIGTIPPHKFENYSYQSPEKTTTEFVESIGLNTTKLAFGWHILLRQEMYNKMKRPGFRVDKKLKKLAMQVFRTDNPAQVKCPRMVGEQQNQTQDTSVN